MNASRFMDKQIMDLSRSSKTDTNSNNPDFINLMNPQSEEEGEGEDHRQHQVEFNDALINKEKQQDILPNYDFHPIHRPNSAAAAATVGRDWGSVDASNKTNYSPLRSYSSVNHVEPEVIDLEKAQKVNDSKILSEIDRTMKTHTDTLMHAIDSLSARLSQMESRTRQLEKSVDDLKMSVGNNHGSNDGKLRQLENILLEVKIGVQDLKDKQEVFEGHMQLAKLQTSKSEQSSEPPNSVNQNPVQHSTASAPPQHSGFQQFAIPVAQPHPSMAPPNAPPPSQQNIHPPLSIASQFPLATTPAGSHHDAYLQPPTQTPDTSSQLYQIPPVQNQQPAPPASLPQQYQLGPTPPYPQLPQPPQQQHPSNLVPMGHRPDDCAYVPSQSYPPNLYQPTPQPSSGPPPTQTYHGNQSSMYEPPPPARAGSGFSSSYVPPSGPNEPYPYGGPSLHFGSGPPVKPQPHSPRGGTGGYPQLPTARVLPQAIPTASGVGSGSNSGGSGNKVPIDDVVDKVTNMGFSRDQVRATVRRLTENGQSVDLNIVLDKLMNDSDVQPPKGWFGR